MFLPSGRYPNDGLFQPFWERAERRKKYPQVIATISGTHVTYQCCRNLFIGCVLFYQNLRSGFMFTNFCKQKKFQKKSKNQFYRAIAIAMISVRNYIFFGCESVPEEQVRGAYKPTKKIDEEK